MPKNNILVITPVRHIEDFVKTIKKMGVVTFREDINYSNLLTIIHEFDIIFTNPNKSKIYLNKTIIDKAKRLKYICTASTGTNHIDCEYLKKKKIRLVSLTRNKKIINKISSTAEHALALTLSALRKIPFSFDGAKKNEWNYENYIGRQMNFLKVGIIGAGRLGSMYANYCQSLFQEIIIYDPYRKIKIKKKIKQVNKLDTLFSDCDIVSIHVHVNEKTINLINKKILLKAKKDLILVNTSRGEVVNEKDLIGFLKKNPLSIYATDVLSNEIKERKDSPILSYAKNTKKQIIITQHIGGMTREGQKIAYLGVLKELEKLLI
jgi:phosphoglycerate dehydrogenase-like enzyme